MRVIARPSDVGKRLDVFLTEGFSEYTRSRIQHWIRAERVLVDGQPARASHLIREGETIDATPIPAPPLAAVAEDIPLKILYEDEDVVAIDKPAGMAVHAGAGVRSGTVVNALLHRFEQLSKLGGEQRPGIVHRLDRYTSGVLLVAKTDLAHQRLAGQFASRQVRKIYLALAHGSIHADRFRVDKPISRDPVRRERMTARLGRGRAAWSEFRVLERFTDLTYLEVQIGTGRTHQIRVHLSASGHPIVGDRLYGAPSSDLGRYFLHAHRIEFEQPTTGAKVEVVSPLAPELKRYLMRLSGSV